MIVTITIRSCPKCGSKNIVKNGTDYQDDQKYHCHICGAYGTLRSCKQDVLSIKELALQTWRERASMRGIERIFGITRQALARWLVEATFVLKEQLSPKQIARQYLNSRVVELVAIRFS